MSFFERLKTAASAEWRAYTEHPFTDGLADGSLPKAAFRHYLVQDYLFLIEFARAYALSVYKSPKLADMREAAAGLSAILDIEMNLHVKLCAGSLRDRLRGDRDAAPLATRCARCNEPISRLDRRVCRCTIPGGRGESAGAPGGSRRSLRHAGPRGRLLGNGLACGPTC